MEFDSPLPIDGVLPDLAAGLRTRALQLTRQRQALEKERVRDGPAVITLAAGRLHITNFDAEFACDAARWAECWETTAHRELIDGRARTHWS